MQFDLKAYLARVGIAETPSEASPATLGRLQLAQARHIPFENMDPLTGKVPDLDPAALWRKLVENRRGGYCFEVNALLGTALSTLGFKAMPIMARVRNGAPRGGPRSHMAFIVTIGNETYLADCGFGGGVPMMPFRLDSAEPQEIVGETYRVRRDEDTGEEVLERQTSEGWYGLYGFERSPAFQPDFEAANFVCARWDKAPFPTNLMMARVTEDGRNTLFNRALKISRNGESEAQRIETFGDFEEAMTGLFGLPEQPALYSAVWDRIKDK
ncbi:arylamine N-acetyltransferase family protein [Rhizobium sp. C4]|uniref:arylamine N-acetyltransferase family protein n=1 Tax=Rhizobium sp. C4 TaxID=1349800 RepID=UPI001E6125E2|nr:arylamine N-acetyltransferase [Rhizobium sp. C4]MCD2171786.1 arylamine N-acetyltransferase [Rhizobium sp. C4]